MTGACGIMKKRTAAPRVQLTNQFIGASGSTAAAATARYRLNSTGIAEQKQGSAAYATLETWLLTGLNSDYEAQLAVESTSGTAGTTTGAGATWLLLSTAREVTFAMTGATSTGQVNIRVKIRDKTTLVELVNALITLESEWL